MRLNLRLVSMLTAVLAIVTFFSVWSRCSNYYSIASDGFDRQTVAPDAATGQPHVVFADVDADRRRDSGFGRIDCRINEEYTVGCRREGSEIFVPFTFIAKYFEVYGKVVADDVNATTTTGDRFEWRHSYSKYYVPRQKYAPAGILLWFEHYNVEVRDRVKCISATEGVPISTQWTQLGYHYPIQIAQYGLSHYSKFLVLAGDRESDVLESADAAVSGRWTPTSDQVTLERRYDRASRSHVVRFRSPAGLESPAAALLKVDERKKKFLSLDVRFDAGSNGSVTVVLESRDPAGQLYRLHYVCADGLLTSASGRHFVYGLGASRSGSGWFRMTRDLETDLQKGVRLVRRIRRFPVARIVAVELRGSGAVDNVTVTSSAHLEAFYAAANWLVRHQDERGGWPIDVTRSFARNALTLPAGWYSAMAQGQAMSLLMRAYHRTKNAHYLDSALAATKLFSLDSVRGGVMTKFMDKYVWYEEYPTNPSSFVLNGFIYSLIGLYDLRELAPESVTAEADVLYTRGIESLKAMLALFDTGSGSVYDLRHVALPGTAPNLARWDYHATHINQLMLLTTIEDDNTVFLSTGQRWISYMNGKRAPHN